MTISRCFSEAKTFVIEYKGKIIRRFYTFERKGCTKVRFSFIESNSTYNQAINLHLSEFKGRIILDGEEREQPKGNFPQLVFAEKECPKVIELIIELEDGNIAICNASDPLGTGQIWHSISQGCAMITEVLGENHFRFYCNDHENDDDFNDFIFDMELFP